MERWLFSANNLFKIGNKYRKIKGLNHKTLREYNSTIFAKDLRKMLYRKYSKARVKVRWGSRLWVHPLLFIDMALFLNPNYEFWIISGYKSGETIRLNPELKEETYTRIFNNLVGNEKDDNVAFKKLSELVQAEYIGVLVGGLA